MRTLQLSLRAAVALAVGACCFSACGAGSGSAGSLHISADPGRLKFDTSSLTAEHGNVTIVMDNPSTLPHNVAIKGNAVDVEGKVVSKGGTSQVSANLKPGHYTFYCSVPGHRAAGMSGTLTVQ